VEDTVRRAVRLVREGSVEGVKMDGGEEALESGALGERGDTGKNRLCITPIFKSRWFILDFS
jgi:hypothetical protein